jgi:hypothetical protein
VAQRLDSNPPQKESSPGFKKNQALVSEKNKPCFSKNVTLLFKKCNPTFQKM